MRTSTSFTAWAFRLLSCATLAATALGLVGCRGLISGTSTGGNGGSGSGSGPFTLTVDTSGPIAGSVTSSPSGINCPGTCSASFASGTSVTLSPASSDGTFTGWGGACSGTGSCTVQLSANSSVTATFGASLQSIKHIVFMVQENRSFDHYFGALRQYWAQNGYPDQPFDGLPQFNNPPGPAATNPGCDPAFPFAPAPAPFNNCTIDSASPTITSYHLLTQCVENPSPTWNEAHVDHNVNAPLSTDSTMDGFVKTAGHEVRALEYNPGSNPPESDVDGIRAMGYYDGTDFPYYYFMASNFATSDRWFSPIMTRTQPNREYLMAATSLGHVYPPPQTNFVRFTNKTIFEDLQDANISWRVYVTDFDTGRGTLQEHTELGMYKFASQFPQNFVPATQFITDAQNDTLPAVSEIDPGFAAGTDEHPGTTDLHPGARVQDGAKYVASLVNALMNSPSWKDTVFILTWDEFGGFYDHVPPQPMPSADGIAPVDLKPGDLCTGSTGPNCDLVFTGYRVPLIVISPFTKKNYVSHTVADYTAILKLIETRFNVPSLTARDAAQMDMTEFFDFDSVPWMTPPTPPDQPTNLPCYMTHLP